MDGAGNGCCYCLMEKDVLQISDSKLHYSLDCDYSQRMKSGRIGIVKMQQSRPRSNFSTISSWLEMIAYLGNRSGDTLLD